MGYFGANEADNYGQNGTDFFFLKNDKDTAMIRFMYNTVDDVRGLAVHTINVGGKDRYISCIRNYNDPVSACPLCAANYSQKARIFIPIYDQATDTAKVWERGKDWIAKLSGLCARYSPLVGTPMEIERQGKAGDSGTKYETYPCQSDDTTLEDLPDLPEVLGTLVLDKTFEEIEEYLATGNFPAVAGEEQTQQEAQRPVNRNVQRDARQPARQAAAPANSGVVRRRPPVGGKESKF